MGYRRKAISMSRLLRQRLNTDGVATARVLASFPQACNMLTAQGDLITLVSPVIGDGPFNIVVDASLQEIGRNTIVQIGGQSLCLGQLIVDLEGVRTWEPCPDWERLGAQQDQILARMPKLRSLASRSLALRQTQPSSLLMAIENTGATAPGSYDSTGTQGEYVASRVRQSALALALGWGGDRKELELGATQLAGLGWGLTPAGDDFLTGFMLWAWLAHPQPQALCHDLLTAAKPRTTILSAAFLCAAASGACSQAWHHLLAGLVGEADLESAVQDVLAHGSTSGADTLAGFLLMDGWQRSLDFPNDTLYNDSV